MKKTIAQLCMIILFIYMLSGCATTTKEHNLVPQSKVTIITSFYPIYLHVVNITKDVPNVEVINMTPPQVGCLHDYQLTPNDIKMLEKADVFVINGGGMETFMDKVVSQLPNIQVITASENIPLLENEDEDHDPHHEEANPHVWVSVTGAIEQVENIANSLGTIDANNRKLYLENAQKYIAQLEELKNEMHQVLDGIQNKNIVTFHEAFSYFAKEFDMNVISTITTESGADPSAKELAQTIEEIKNHNVKAIFAEPQYSNKAAHIIAKETGLQVYTLDPIVTGEANPNQIDAYIVKMKENVRTLKEALQ